MNIALTADPEIPVPPLFYGGIERIIAMLIGELQAEGHEVTLFAHRDSRVFCKLVAYPATGNRKTDVIRNSWVVNNKLFSGRYDIVHSFGRLAYLLPQLPLSIPKVMSYQREPTIAQIKKAVSLSRKGSLMFTGCSDYITQQLATVAEAVTVYNGVDMEKFVPSANVEPDAPLVFLGRIEPIKGPHIAIRIALDSGKKLVIAGNVPPLYKAYFDQEISPFLNEQISYIGAVDDVKKNILLRSGLALLMPIQWNEPFGIVMAEAMACGTPVLAFNRGAVPEVVVHGINGFIGDTVADLVDAVSLAKRIDRLMVRKIAEEKFSAGVIARQYISLYQHLIAGR